MEALAPAGEPNWQIVVEPQKHVRFCANEVNDICNWAVPAESDSAFCPACSHNRLVPDIATAQGIDAKRKTSAVTGPSHPPPSNQRGL